MAYECHVHNPHPVRLVVEDDYRRRRLTVFFRLLLAIPHLIWFFLWTVWIAITGFVNWLISIFTGRPPRWFHRLMCGYVRYQAHLATYLYPNADPTEMLVAVTDRPPRHPVRVAGDPYDLRRSRVTVFFRLLLALPHLLWLVLWGIVALLVAIVQWFVTLFRGTPARALHRFISAYIRYRLHVAAYLFLVANPFPGFTGAPGVYPLDLEVGDPQRQNRWKTGFRVLLAIPAFIVDTALSASLLTAAVLTWFYALVKGSAPWGLRNLAAYALRYDAQANSYLYLVTDAYPH